LPEPVISVNEYEYGVRMPDGQEVWPPDLIFGVDVQIAANRAQVVTAISGAVANMGFPASDLGRYQWLVREIQVLTVRRVVEIEIHDFDDPNLVVDHGTQPIEDESSETGIQAP
jgi:hypothetical protein